jgi:hypothetical protein
MLTFTPTLLSLSQFSFEKLCGFITDRWNYKIKLLYKETNVLELEFMNEN